MTLIKINGNTVSTMDDVKAEIGKAKEAATKDSGGFDFGAVAALASGLASTPTLTFEEVQPYFLQKRNSSACHVLYIGIMFVRCLRS